MDIINHLIDTYNVPVLTAFLLGILTSISPCPLATNITAVAYISKDIESPKVTIIKGLIYTLGRGVSYTLLSILMYFGLSSFQVSRVFQGWGDKLLGPILILIGLIMLNVIRINTPSISEKTERLKKWFAGKGNLGVLFLGMLLALAFCPYSGVLFFGVLTPLILGSSEWILLPPIYALGTGIPVIVFALILVFSMKKMTRAFTIVSNIEKFTRYVVGATFIIVGVYYLRFLITYLSSF